MACMVDACTPHGVYNLIHHAWRVAFLSLLSLSLSDPRTDLPLEKYFRFNSVSKTD